MCGSLLSLHLVCSGCVQAELTFSAGDIIHVFGDMDEDGFFYVSVTTPQKKSDVYSEVFVLETDEKSKQDEITASQDTKSANAFLKCFEVSSW